MGCGPGPKGVCRGVGGTGALIVADRTSGGILAKGTKTYGVVPGARQRIGGTRCTSRGHFAAMIPAGVMPTQTDYHWPRCSLYVPITSYEPVSLGLKFSIRICNLTARDVLVVTCTACHAQFNVAPHHLHARYHELRKLIDVEKDFKCKRCGADHDLRWHIMRATGPKYPASA